MKTHNDALTAHTQNRLKAVEETTVPLSESLLEMSERGQHWPYVAVALVFYLATIFLLASAGVMNYSFAISIGPVLVPQSLLSGLIDVLLMAACLFVALIYGSSFAEDYLSCAIGGLFAAMAAAGLHLLPRAIVHYPFLAIVIGIMAIVVVPLVVALKEHSLKQTMASVAVASLLLFGMVGMLHATEVGGVYASSIEEPPKGTLIHEEEPDFSEGWWMLGVDAKCDRVAAFMAAEGVCCGVDKDPYVRITDLKGDTTAMFAVSSNQLVVDVVYLQSNPEGLVTFIHESYASAAQSGKEGEQYAGGWI